MSATCATRAPLYSGNDIAAQSGGCSLADARPPGPAFVLAALGLALAGLRRARRTR